MQFPVSQERIKGSNFNEIAVWASYLEKTTGVLCKEGQLEINYVNIEHCKFKSFPEIYEMF